MAVPANTTAALAVDLGALPASVAQAVDDAGTTYTVWYSYTAVAGDNVIGLWGFGGAISGGYEPTVTIWTGPVGALTQYIGTDALIDARNKPIQFPVTVGVTYYLRFAPNGNFTPSNLTLDALRWSGAGTLPRGAIFINDDTGGFPAAVLSSTNGDDYTVLNFIQGIVAGEAGEALDLNGRILLTDDFVDHDVKVYDHTLTLLASVALPVPTTTNTRLTANQVTGRVYVGTPGIAASVSILDANGVLLDTQTLPSPGLTGLAASVDDTMLYVVNYSGSAINKAVKRWDLLTETMLSDLVAGLAGYATKDIIVLKDDTILVAYNISGVGTPRVVVKRYSPAGATLNTYTVTNGAVVSQIIATALDNPASFWVWTHDEPVAGISRFLNIRVADGAVLAEIDQVEYELGVYNAAETATPIARFGNSFSCPFLILRGAITPPPPPTTSVCPPQAWLTPATPGCVAIGELPDNSA